MDPAPRRAILNRNPESQTFNQPERRPVVYLYELKHDLNAYLRDWAKGTKMKTMSDIIAFNTRMRTSRCASARTSSSPPRRRAAI